MVGKHVRGLLAIVCHGMALLLTGCAVSSNGLVFFPSGQRLLDSTKEVRMDSSQPLPLPRELNKTVLPAYVVEPGDVLLVQPAGLDSPIRLPADQPVLPDGSINLGRYGRLIVAGMTTDEIATRVHDKIAVHEPEAARPKIGPIMVRLVVRASKVYYVLGEVNAPGSFPLSGRETVLDGIIAAGGLNQRASQSQIILSRPTRPDGCRIVLPVCYREIVQLGDTTTNYQLLPGDRIFVPTRQSHEDSQGGCLPWRKKKPCLAVCDRPQTACPTPAVCTGAALSPMYHFLGKPVPVRAPAPHDAESLPIPPTPWPDPTPIPPSGDGPAVVAPTRLPNLLPAAPVPVLVQTSAQQPATSPGEGSFWRPHPSRADSFGN